MGIFTLSPNQRQESIEEQRNVPDPRDQPPRISPNILMSEDARDILMNIINARESNVGEDQPI